MRFNLTLYDKIFIVNTQNILVAKLTKGKLIFRNIRLLSYAKCSKIDLL